MGTGRLGAGVLEQRPACMTACKHCLHQAAEPESTSTAARCGSMPSLWPWGDHLPPPAMLASRCWCTWRSSPPTLARACTAWAPRPWRRLAPATRCARAGAGAAEAWRLLWGAAAIGPSVCESPHVALPTHLRLFPRATITHLLPLPLHHSPCRATCLATPPMRPPSSCP